MWKMLGREYIDEFKAHWPCHGLPSELSSLMADFDSNGDLIDLAAFADDGRLLDTHDFDGPALVALVKDCQKKGHLSR